MRDRSTLRWFLRLGEHVLLVAGPSPAHPHANHRLEDIRLSSATAA